MSFWPKQITPEMINNINKNSMFEHLGMKIIEIKDDYIKASMPVDHRTVQPIRVLHGGASLVMSETLGSIASNIVVSKERGASAAGISINADHIKTVFEGSMIYGITRPISLGKSIHVWETTVYNDKDEVVCISRLTTKLISRKNLLMKHF